MSLFKSLTKVGKQISIELGIGDLSSRHENLMQKAKKVGQDLNTLGSQICGIADRAEGKFPTEKDSIFWISHVTKQILSNHQALRNIKHDAVYLGTIADMIGCQNFNAAEFAFQLAKELTRQQNTQLECEKELENKQRQLAQAEIAKINYPTEHQNKKACEIPHGMKAKELIQNLEKINEAFPIILGFDSLRLLSKQIGEENEPQNLQEKQQEKQQEKTKEKNRSKKHLPKVHSKNYVGQSPTLRTLPNKTPQISPTQIDLNHQQFISIPLGSYFRKENDLVLSELASVLKSN